MSVHPSVSPFVILLILQESKGSQDNLSCCSELPESKEGNASGVHEGLNARSEVYLSKEYFCKMYPTCVSSKLCKFILIQLIFIIFEEDDNIAEQV